MPAWGEVLKRDEIEALADYLISLKPKSSGEEW
jgi:mono/diheme cytochrome c family protein